MGGRGKAEACAERKWHGHSAACHCSMAERHPQGARERSSHQQPPSPPSLHADKHLTRQPSTLRAYTSCLPFDVSERGSAQGLVPCVPSPVEAWPGGFVLQNSSRQWMAPALTLARHATPAAQFSKHRAVKMIGNMAYTADVHGPHSIRAAPGHPAVTSSRAYGGICTSRVAAPAPFAAAKGSAQSPVLGRVCIPPPIPTSAPCFHNCRH